MKTIKTAAYAAVAATTSKGRLVVATDMIEMNTQMKPVMIPSLALLDETNSNHHIGANSAINPVKIMLLVVKRSNFSLLEYTVVSESMWTSGMIFALNGFHRCTL
jgi:hypothetical protein